MNIETMNIISSYDCYNYYGNIYDADYVNDNGRVDYYYVNYYGYVNN